MHRKGREEEDGLATETEQAQMLGSKPVRPIILSSGNPADKMQELRKNWSRG